MAREPAETLTLTELARVGFAALGVVRERLAEVAELGGPAPKDLLALLAKTASPDAALAALLDLLRSAPGEIQALLAHDESALRFLRVAGASTGLTEFFLRHPEELAILATTRYALPKTDEVRADLLDSVGAIDGFSTLVDDPAWVALRVRYRRRLAEIAAFDLEQVDPVSGVAAVAGSLADLAAATLDAALAVARRMTSGTVAGRGVFPIEQVRATRLAIIGMGKAGASELNYISDVDVIFVAEASPDEADGQKDGQDDPVVDTARAVDIATRLAILLNAA